MSLIRKAAASFIERRGADPRQPWGDSTPPAASSAGSYGSGIPVTQQTATGLAAVYGSCALIADSVASLPWMLRTGPAVRGTKQLPSSPLLNRPYAEISRNDWLKQACWALALRGNFFGQVIERDGLQRPVQIKPIHNDFVQLWRDTASGELKYRFYGALVPLQDVFHVRYQSWPGEFIGIGPISVLGLSFGTAIARERYAEAFFLNSANPMGVIEVPGYMDRVETRKMMRSWLASKQGLNQAHLPAILTEGAAWKPISINPADSQLLEALQYSAQMIIGQIFRVPGHMLGFHDQSPGHGGTSIEMLERSFINNCLNSYMGAITEALTNVHTLGQYVVFDPAERLRAGIDDLATAIQKLVLGGTITPNDGRTMLDLDDIKGGDLLILPPNATLRDSNGLPMPPPQAPTPPPATTTTTTSANGSGKGPAQAKDIVKQAVASPNGKP